MVARFLLVATTSNPLNLTHIHSVGETNACLLANASPFWAGQVENWPNRVEFCIEHIDGLVQERFNFSALAMKYVFLALTHQYKEHLFWDEWSKNLVSHIVHYILYLIDIDMYIYINSTAIR